MIELHTKYRPGQRTYVYLVFKYGWLYILLGAGAFYLAYKMMFGSLNAPLDNFLSAHSDWFIDVFMVTQWTASIAVAILLVGLLRVTMQYRRYSFFVDENAFHLRKGLIRVQEITIPYRQVSNVHIEQPYHWRLFGLAQVDVTMTSSRTTFKTKKRDFLIPVIDKYLAHELSHFLIKKASGETDEDNELEEEEDGEDVEVEEHV